MRKIRVSSVLPASFRDELERIVFFNPEQSLVTTPLVDAIRRYGVPTILEEDGYLRFRVRAFGQLQTLYAFDDTGESERLAGVAMFIRQRRNSLWVLHLAAHEDYTASGQWSGEGVVAQLIAAIRGIGLRTRGIQSLRVLYPHEVRFDLRTEPINLRSRRNR